MRTTTIACTAIALTLLAGASFAQTYRWLDQNGRVHYTDTPPPPTATQAEEKKLSSNVVQTDALPYSAQLAVKNFPVTLYSAANCGQPCTDGRNLLVKRGVPFKEIAVGDEKSREALQKASGSNEVPVLTVGHDVRKGYLDSAWHSALDAAGYPKSGSAANATKREPTKPATEPQPGTKDNAADSAPGPYTPRF